MGKKDYTLEKDVGEPEQESPNIIMKRLLNDVINRDLVAVDFFGPELEGSTDLYAIRVTALREPGGSYLPLYGIYNRQTGVRESEVRQFKAAKDWAKNLTTIFKGGKLPGLEPTSEGEATTPPELGSA